jgi:hypothetical protein
MSTENTETLAKIMLLLATKLREGEVNEKGELVITFTDEELRELKVRTT